MKVLVTGASGFLGSHICQQLGEQGHEVRAMVRKTSDTRLLRTLPNVSLFQARLDDPSSCAAACADTDAVIHAAGLVKACDVTEFHDCNVLVTRNMLDGALGASVKRFVYVSSLTARAPSPDGHPLPLDADPRPVTHYGRSKLEAERLVLEAKDKTHVTVVRPTGVYGPRDREMLQLFQYASLRVLPFIGDPQGKLTLIHGADCAAATILCLTADIPSGRAYDLDDGIVYNRTELAAGLEDAVGKKALVSFPIPNVVVRTVGWVSQTYSEIARKAVMLRSEKVEELLQQWVGNSKPAFDELGFKPKWFWPAGSKMTAQWYYDEQWIKR